MQKLKQVDFTPELQPIRKIRIVHHNAGNGSKFAKDQGPLELIYTSKPFPNKSEARKREIQIKGWSRDKKLKLINGEWS